jgi:4'-phosphopantetheinyl transferase EntD
LLPLTAVLNARNSDFAISPMPLFYQQDINEHTRFGLWRIEESPDFFQESVPVSREISHPHKRLQHLAGRYLLRQLFPDFPMEMILIADTRKPFLADESFHFSISHCGNWAAAIVSRNERVGIDVESSSPRIMKVAAKFLDLSEIDLLIEQKVELSATLLWSAKESMYKWYGDGGIDFSEHLRLLPFNWGDEGLIPARFLKNGRQDLVVHYKIWDALCLSWVHGSEVREEAYTG